MKRSETKWIVLALAVLLLLTQGSDASEKKKATKGQKAPAVGGFVHGLLGAVVGYAPAPPVTAAGVDLVLVKDLVEIIDSTESPTTFALTVMALEQLGEKAKSTVPSIIRNAERLKIFSSTNAVATPNTVPTKKQQLASAVAQSMVNLLNGNRPAPTAPVCGQFPNPMHGAVMRSPAYAPVYPQPVQPPTPQIAPPPSLSNSY